MANIVANPKQKISALQYITGEELRHLMAEWTGTTTQYPHNSTVCELFEQQAKQTPEAVALMFEDRKLSYRELNGKANQLARRLQSDGIQIENRVAIYMERSAEMIIALLGVLKSGATYVALDPVYPADRIALQSENLIERRPGTQHLSRCSQISRSQRNRFLRAGGQAH